MVIVEEVAMPSLNARRNGRAGMGRVGGHQMPVQMVIIVQTLASTGDWGEEPWKDPQVPRLGAWSSSRLHELPARYRIGSAN